LLVLASRGAPHGLQRFLACVHVSAWHAFGRYRPLTLPEKYPLLEE